MPRSNNRILENIKSPDASGEKIQRNEQPWKNLLIKEFLGASDMDEEDKITIKQAGAELVQAQNC